MKGKSVRLLAVIVTSAPQSGTTDLLTGYVGYSCVACTSISIEYIAIETG